MALVYNCTVVAAMLTELFTFEDNTDTGIRTFINMHTIPKEVEASHPTKLGKSETNRRESFEEKL